MKIFNLKNFDKKIIDEDISIILGNFDGIHKGHQKLIDKLMKTKYKKAVLFFDPHPGFIFTYNFKELLDLDSKIEYFKPFIDYVIVLKTNQTILDTSKDKFIDFLINNNVKEIVCGKDFNFGYNKEGKVADLENRFIVHVVDDIDYKNERISSTRIRKALNEGDVSEANKMLGKDYFIEGMVIHGNQLGRTINYKTANLNEIKTLIPKEGVYLGYSYLNGDKTYGLINVGKPTFVKNANVKVEIHYLGIDEEMYGMKLKIYFIKRLRDIKELHSIEELKELLDKDLEKAKKYLAKTN